MSSVLTAWWCRRRIGLRLRRSSRRVASSAAFSSWPILVLLYDRRWRDARKPLLRRRFRRAETRYRCNGPRLPICNGRWRADPGLYWAKEKKGDRHMNIGRHFGHQLHEEEIHLLAGLRKL